MSNERKQDMNVIYSLRKTNKSSDKEDILKEINMIDIEIPDRKHESFFYGEDEYWTNRIVKTINDDGTISITVVFHQLQK